MLPPSTAVVGVARGQDASPRQPAAAGGLLPELRAATRPQHDRIEQLLALQAPMPLRRYAAIVLGFQHFLTGWEQELVDALPARLHGWLAARSRRGFVAQDVEFLAAALPVDVMPAAARCLPAPCLAAAFGALYVIEGSALGGQVITPWLQRDLGLTPGRGASYFHGFGERTGAMWKEFRELAQAEVGDAPADRALAVRAAEQTFEALMLTMGPLLR